MFGAFITLSARGRPHTARRLEHRIAVDEERDVDGSVGDGALAMVGGRGDTGGLVRALTTLRLGLDLLVAETGAVSDADRLRLLALRSEAAARVTDLMTRLTASSGSPAA